jgi:transposase
MPLKDMAVKYGVTYGTLWRWRKKAGAKCMTRGEHHWNAKLTQQQVNEIRALRAKGVEQKELAQRFNVSQSTISNIVNYGSW